MIGNKIENRLRQLARNILKEKRSEIKSGIRVFLPEKIEYGDLSSNFLFFLAKFINKNPQEIFEEYKDKIIKALPFIEDIKVLNGYLNFYLNKKILFEFYKAVALRKFEIFKNNIGRRQKFIIEYVSANPTGPLHLGNARGAILGDTLANLLKLCGFRVTKEYYVNDRGKQVDILLDSILYYLNKREYKEEYYKGEYIKEIAEKFKGKISSLNETQLKKFIVNYILENYIKKPLYSFGTRFDNFYFESDLYKKDLDKKILKVLEKKNLIEEKEGALWLSLTKLNEPKDEVLIKKDGEPTYFFSDILYNYEKLFIRRFKYSLIIVAADHQDHVRRLSSVFEKIFNVKERNFKFLVYQMVHLMKENEILRMSKRKGTYVTLEDVINLVNKDALRFYFAKYAPGNTIEIDLDILQKENEENPVWYTLYTYARFLGILRKAKEQKFVLKKESVKTNLTKSFNYIKDKEEYLKILRMMTQLAQLIQESAIFLRPNLIFQYFINFCKELNSFYEKERILEKDEYTKLRLIFVLSILNFLDFLFSIFNIKPQEGLRYLQNKSRNQKS